MKKISKLNIGLFLVICALVLLLMNQNKKNTEALVEQNAVLLGNFYNFLFLNIDYYLDALQVLKESGNIVDVKTKLETNMIFLFFHFSLYGEISDSRVNKKSLITLCRLRLYEQNNNLEKKISDTFSELINSFYIQNEGGLNAMYKQNEIDEVTCVTASGLMPNFRKLDVEINKLNN